MSQLTAISPLDGRYFNDLKELSKIFSESALIKYRLKVEIEYLIALSNEEKIKEVRELTDKERVSLRLIYERFNEVEAEKVKKLEKTTNHDVKAVEYYLKEKIKKIALRQAQGGERLKDYLEFVHFALTSEDVNNLAYSLMLKDGVAIYQKELKKLLSELKLLALKYKRVPMLSMTHGQPASPTTLGKELAVFYQRIDDQLGTLSRLKLKGKFSGAVGNWNAQVVTYKNIDWIAFSQRFVESLGLEFNPLTIQIEPHDSVAVVYHNLVRINNIIKDLDQDIWLYISRGIFKQKRVKGEVGSSTMPHKVNPIYFENSEGNLGIANAIFNHLANKLPISRMQRDLTDSTTLRNQGVALGYSLLAIKSNLKGLARVDVDKKRISEELNNHWEVLTEPIQVILRKAGYNKPYETLKKLTHGKKVTKSDLHKFIRSLKIEKSVKDQLLKLTPESYVGLAGKVVEKFVK